jgi:hypothetical protein
MFFIGVFLFSVFQVIAQRSRATSSLGLNQRYLSDLPNHPKYKTNFPLSQLPKSVVACVGGWAFYRPIEMFS